MIQREAAKETPVEDPTVLADRVISVIRSSHTRSEGAYTHRKEQQSNIQEKDIKALCVAAQAVLLSQPMVLDLEAPAVVVGDLRGQFADLMRVFEKCGFPGQSFQAPIVDWTDTKLIPSGLVPMDLVDHTAGFVPSPLRPFVFLGNYVGRCGVKGIDTFCLLLAFKVKYPTGVYLLRGHFDCAQVSRIHGFYDECKRYFNVRMWKGFMNVMNCLPLAAVVGKKMFCVHGGLSPDIMGETALDKLIALGPRRPLDMPEEGLMCDLIWSEPMDQHDEGLMCDTEDWRENDRGVSYTFHPRTVSKFLEGQEMDIIVRGHQVIENGYELSKNKQLVTLFTASNLGNEFGNVGAFMVVDAGLQCSFTKIGDHKK